LLSEISVLAERWARADTTEPIGILRYLTQVGFH
jgi:hypothetical protein